MGLVHSVSSAVVQRKGNALYKVAMSTRNGSREALEDYSTIVLDLPKHKDTAFFAVYDGHGVSEHEIFLRIMLSCTIIQYISLRFLYSQGQQVAEHLSNHFHHVLDNLENIEDKDAIVEAALVPFNFV